MKKSKLNVQLWMAIILVILGCILLISGFIVPPLGVIDSSVLVAYGEICTFAGSLLGIDYNYRFKMYKHDASKDNS